MTTPRDLLYAGYRYPAELISYAVWLYFRFPLSLRMVEEMLAARGLVVTYETIRQWGPEIRPGVRQPHPPACPGQRTVSAALRVMGLADRLGFGRYHEVLSEAR